MDLIARCTRCLKLVSQPCLRPGCPAQESVNRQSRKIYALPTPTESPRPLMATIRVPGVPSRPPTTLTPCQRAILNASRRGGLTGRKKSKLQHVIDLVLDGLESGDWDPYSTARETLYWIQNVRPDATIYQVQEALKRIRKQGLIA